MKSGQVADTGLVALVDGQPAESLSLADSAVVRGDGCFEAMRAYDGHLFRADDHLDRMAKGAAAIGLTMPSRTDLHAWMKAVMAGRGDCVVRVILTRGSALPGVDGEPHCLVMSHPLPPRIRAFRLLPVPAPWHPAGRPWDLAGVKTISYAPNMAASRRAKAAGFDDALLVSDDEIVLEGPTFSLGWVKGGRVFTPDLKLGILESITRRVVLEVWPQMEEVRDSLDAVFGADEVFVMSTVKEVSPVVAIGATTFETGPVSAEIAQRLGLEFAGADRSH